MTWTKTGEEWIDDPRTEGLIAPAFALFLAGMCISNRVTNDGLLKGRPLQETVMKANLEDEGQKKRALRSIVSSGTWHDHRTASLCESPFCQMFLEERGPVPKGAYLICEFHKDQPSKNVKLVPVEFLRWLRDNDLTKNRRLCEQIQLRDHDLCRYCGGAAKEVGRPVKWSDHRSDYGGTYDHIDPWCTDGYRGFGNTLENVVVACKQCNGRKKDRTPEQWVAAGGLPLLPPPGSEPSPDPLATGSGTKADPPSRARGARDGTDRVPTQSRVGPEPAGNGNGRGH